MTTALVIPFGADASPSGQRRREVWARCRELWHNGFGHGDERTFIIAGDPLFNMPAAYASILAPGDAEIARRATRLHPFSVARAVNRAVRLAPPEVDSFVCIGADALPDWRVVDWAAEELKTRPWTLLFNHGGNAEFTEDGDVTTSGMHAHGSPTVGPIAFTRAAFLAVRGYDERFEGWAYEDVDLWSRLRVRFPLTGNAASPYPLVQFSHPTTHHDLSDANPNVRLWKAKCSTFSTNDHPAPQLFGGEE